MVHSYDVFVGGVYDDRYRADQFSRKYSERELREKIQFLFLDRHRNFAQVKRFCKLEGTNVNSVLRVKGCKSNLWTAWKFVRPGQKWLNSGTF